MAFDIGSYTRKSSAVAFDDLDLESFRSDPLPAGTLRTLTYMADVEYHTVCYLRDILVTPSHTDPSVTAFMTMWNVEEFWHGEALSKVLGAHGIGLDYDHLKAVRLKRGWRDRLSPIVQSLAANVVGRDWVAVHMAWGAANEWSAITAYNRMAETETHPVLRTLLGRIAKQEAQHVAFYATQARERLAASRKARVLTRYALQQLWGPVGSGVMAESEVRHVLHHLMSGAAGRRAAAKIDDHIANLPGLNGLRIVQAALDRRGVPAG